MGDPTAQASQVTGVESKGPRLANLSTFASTTKSFAPGCDVVEGRVSSVAHCYPKQPARAPGEFPADDIDKRLQRSTTCILEFAARLRPRPGASRARYLTC